MPDKVRARTIFIRRLLRWFKTHGRNYPWRHTRDPYRIFVAEFMLQRTGARQVVPVYQLFIKTFPCLQDASEAPPTTIRSILRPLGRVKRYKVLQMALRHLAEGPNVRFPSSLDRLLEIPGVGPYTARAILVFAHRRRHGLFDPNIYRVISRVFDLKSTKARPHADARMWAAVDDLIPKGRSREMNLALLDLASRICRTRKPLHEECPVRDVCAYYRRVRRETPHVH